MRIVNSLHRPWPLELPVSAPEEEATSSLFTFLRRYFLVKDLRNKYIIKNEARSSANFLFFCCRPPSTLAGRPRLSPPPDLLLYHHRRGCSYQIPTVLPLPLFSNPTVRFPYLSPNARGWIKPLTRVRELQCGPSTVYTRGTKQHREKAVE